MSKLIKRLAQAVKDQGKGRGSVTGTKPKRKPADTPAKKRLVRLREGLPLASGKTPKETKTKSGTTIGGLLAKAIMDRAHRKDAAKAKRKTKAAKINKRFRSKS